MDILVQRLLTLSNFIEETETEDKEFYQKTIAQAIKIVKFNMNLIKEIKKCLNLK